MDARDEPRRLHPELRGAISRFALWVANGTVGYPLLEGVDEVAGTDLMREGSATEMAFAIFLNNLELDAEGRPLNARHAEIRAAQYLRDYCDPAYATDPPLADFEGALLSPAVLTNAPGWPPRARD